MVHYFSSFYFLASFPALCGGGFGEKNVSLQIVNKVLNPDICFGAIDIYGAHELAAHGVLSSKKVLNANVQE